VRKKATERLQALVEPALVELSRVLRDKHADDAVKVRAALGILDRTGHGPGAKLEVGVVTEFDRLLDQMESEELEQFRAFQRMGGGVDRSSMLPGRGRRALPSGVGDHSWEDVEQAVSSAQDDADRERADAEPEVFRVSNVGHDVVRGQVVDNDPPPHLR
jgi:hypothetical protein